MWVRVGPRRAVASAEEERRLAERRRASDLPFDGRPLPSVSLDDLDLRLFEETYLPAALPVDVLTENDRTIQQRLVASRFLSPEGVPTATGALVLAAEPTRFIPVHMSSSYASTARRLLIRLRLVVGDLALSGFEDELSAQWSACADGKERAFRVISAFWRIVTEAAERYHADLVLLDVGPNLGAINRSALVASDQVVIPLSPDLFSLQGLRNLGPTLGDWRRQWQLRRGYDPRPDRLPLPEGRMEPVGYVVLQHSIRLDRPAKAYGRWIRRIPRGYGEDVLGMEVPPTLQVREDPNCLALIKHYRSLMPMAQEARKPVFHLKPVDGALGAHLNAVRDAYVDFAHLAERIESRLPQHPRAA